MGLHTICMDCMAMYQPLETDDIGSPDIEFREKNYEGRSDAWVAGREICDYGGGSITVVGENTDNGVSIRRNGQMIL